MDIVNEIKTLFSNKSNYNKKNIIYADNNVELFYNMINRPHAMIRKDLVKLSNIKWAVTEKADGEHMLFYINSESKCFMINNNWDVTPVDCSTHLKDIMFEGELIESSGILYVFDIFVSRKKDITYMPFFKRHKIMKQIVQDLMYEKVKMKTFLFDNEKALGERIKAILSGTYDYELDGVVFVQQNKDYRATILKWKPNVQSTVDFWIKHDADSIGLYVTATPKIFKKNKRTISPEGLPLEKSTHYPFLFSEIKNLMKCENGEELGNHQIVECRLEDEKWIPTKIRDDKTKLFNDMLQSNTFKGPNAWLTAVNTVKYLNNPITEEDLFSMKGYYSGIDRNSSKIKNMLGYHNFVKGELYKKYLKYNKNVLEIAGGRGGDLFKLLSRKPIEIVLIDNDSSAIKEAKRRWGTIKNKGKTKFKTYQNDITTRSKEFTTSKGEKFDFISCHFAWHYFKANQQELLNHIYDSLNPKGYLVMTLFDGDKIDELAEETEWTIDGKKVFSIKKKGGDVISVFVETIGEHDEEIIHSDNTIEIAYRFDLIENCGFHDFREPKNLSKEELEFSRLNHILVFQK